MEIMESVIAFFKTDTGLGVMTVLLATSEALASIPAVKANSIYQLVMGLVARVLPKPAV